MRWNSYGVQVQEERIIVKFWLVQSQEHMGLYGY